MANRFSVEAIFKAVDRVSAPVSRMQNKIGRFSRRLDRNLSRANKTLGRMAGSLKRIGLVGAASLAILAGGFMNVINVGAQFEQSIVSAAVKFPGEIRKGTAAFKELENAAREVGRTTEFTAVQSAKALDFLAMAGFSAKASIAALPTVVDLATVAQIDLGLATDIATDSLGAFNLLSKDAVVNQKNLVRVADVLAKTATRANTTVESMFEALKQGAPVATAAGQSVETVAAMIAAMANAGIKGTKAGTGLKNIMLAIGAPGSAAAKIFRQLKVDTLDMNGDVRDAIDVFADLSGALKKLPQGQQLAIFNQIFGKIPIAAAINISNATDSMREFRKELLSGTGGVKEMGAVIRDTTLGRLNSLKSAIESVKLSIFETNKGPLNEIIGKMTMWVRANEQLIATNVGRHLATVFENLDKIARAIKIAGLALGTFLAVWATVKVAMGVAFLVANPWILVAIGIGAAIVMIVTFAKQLRGLIKELDGLSDKQLREVFKASLPKFIQDRWEPLAAFFKSMRKDIEAIGRALETISSPIKAFSQGTGIFSDSVAPKSRPGFFGFLTHGASDLQGAPTPISETTGKPMTMSEIMADFRASQQVGREGGGDEKVEVVLRNETGMDLSRVGPEGREAQRVRLKIINSGAF